MHPRLRELLDYWDQQRRVLRAAFEAVPVDLRDRAPAQGRWSTANVIEHLALVEGRVAGRFTARVTEARAEGVSPETSTEPMLPTMHVNQMVDRSAPRTAPEPVQPTALTAEAAWAALEHSTAALRAAIQAGDGLALGTVLMPHPLFGPVSLYHWIALTGGHEARHAAQIREIHESLASVA